MADPSKPRMRGVYPSRISPWWAGVPALSGGRLVWRACPTWEAARNHVLGWIAEAGRHA